MRQNNQNKRVRGRTRKGPNPLTRSYESNGPDVKIRGSAMHVAEKYVQLARDAQSAGDRVMAENYLQHAEHYFRIIAAAQGANSPQRDNDQPYQGNQGNGADAGSGGGNNGSGQSNQVMAADAPQPFVDAMPGVNTKGGNGSKPSKGATGDDAASEAPATAEEAPTGGENADADKGVEAKAEEAKSAEAGDDAPKPKRRVRGTRGRGSRKTKAEDGADGGGDDAKGAEAKSDGGEAKADSAEGAVSEA
ncbi:hypothetical protein GGD81_004663 [Rhodobium orientis]|uniref:DUF4167 domain-containing protein n=1 Tax=Rhodobium orientis TaxID=34017 RepID=UPI00179AA668|nr:DUF4167 domain-containing protein [Rhodobium orientis]MBB4305582.1 hypothetical protein [Rhodobium orientis]